MYIYTCMHTGASELQVKLVEDGHEALDEGALLQALLKDLRGYVCVCIYIYIYTHIWIYT